MLEGVDELRHRRLRDAFGPRQLTEAGGAAVSQLGENGEAGGRQPDLVVERTQSDAGVLQCQVHTLGSVHWTPP